MYRYIHVYFVTLPVYIHFDIYLFVYTYAHFCLLILFLHAA